MPGTNWEGTSMKGSLRTRLWITVVATATLCLAALAGGGPSAAAAPAAKPGIITSAGQSSDAVMVNVLANTQLKLGLDFDPLVQAESLVGYRTLVVVVGASAKGLGAAGINEEQEMARVTALVGAGQGPGRLRPPHARGRHGPARPFLQSLDRGGGRLCGRHDRGPVGE